VILTPLSPDLQYRSLSALVQSPSLHRLALIYLASYISFPKINQSKNLPQEAHHNDKTLLLTREDDGAVAKMISSYRLLYQISSRRNSTS